MPVFVAIMTVSEIHSQSGNDTVCMSTADAIYHIGRSDSLTGYKKLVFEKQKDIDTLNARIIILGEKIKEYQGKDSLYKDIRLLMEGQMKDMKNQRATLEAEVASVKKELRRERFKRKIITGVGILSTAGALLLTLKK